MDPGRLNSTRVIALALALLAAYKAYAVYRLASRGISLFIDDAFYYLLIARNFAETGIPTFDGIHATNGFHPLWMLMLAAMYKVIGTGAGLVTQIVAAKGLEWGTLGACLGMCVLGFHRLRDQTPLAWGFLGAAVILLAPRLYLFDQGMESTLAAGLLLACIYAVLDDKPRWLMVCMPLLFLARLDSLVFLLGPLALWWFMARPASWEQRAFVLAPVAIAVVAYLGLNLVLTGQANTVSGQIKSSFPVVTLHLSYLIEPLQLAPHLGWGVLYALPNALVPSVLLAIVAIVCLVKRGASWTGPVAWIVLMAVLLIANIVLFQRWDKGVDARYLSLPYVLLGFAVLATLANVWPQGKAVTFTFWVLLIACSVVLAQRYREERPMRMDLAKANEVKAMTKPGERFAGTDVGAFSFWLERPFVNLDGLVNNRELQDVIRDKRLAEYLERNDVRYLLAAFWDREQTHVSWQPERMYKSRIFPAGVAGKAYPHYDFHLYSYIFDTQSDEVRFCPQDEIFREAIGRDGIANAAIVIYRVGRPVRRAGSSSCPNATR